jgi:protein-tyrosine phosphatase
MAEAVFMNLVKAAGLQHQISADSAGIDDWHVGQPPHPGTRRSLAARGILSEHRARMVTRRDLDAFDYILTMDASHLRALRALGNGRAVLRPFLDYAPDSGFTEVPDPYFSGLFDQVHDLIHEAAEGLLDAIRQEHGL